MCCIKVVGSTELNIYQNVGLVARSGPGTDSGSCESKDLAHFCMKFLIQNGVSFLCSSSPGTVLFLSNVGQLLLCESFITRLSLKKVTYYSLKILAKSWTSLEEGPLHCLHRGQGQTHESGSWFRDWNLNNLEEFVLEVLVLAFCSYFLGLISYILMRY